MQFEDMSPSDWQGIADYMLLVRNHLGLHAWHLYIANKPCAKKYQASIAPTYGRKYATIYFSRNWPDVDVVEQKQTIVHELLHLLFIDVQSAVDRVSKLVDRKTFSVIWDNHTEALEYAIDALSELIAAQLPDPPAIGIPAPETNS